MTDTQQDIAPDEDDKGDDVQSFNPASNVAAATPPDAPADAPPVSPAPAQPTPAITDADRAAFQTPSTVSDADRSAFENAANANTPTMLGAALGAVGGLGSVLPESIVGPHELSSGQRDIIAAKGFWNIAKAFGQGSWDYATQSALDDPDNQALAKAGIYKNYLNAEDVAHKSFMDGVIVPAVQTAAGALESTAARAGLVAQIGIGAVSQGVSDALTQVGEEQKSPSLGRDLNLMMEAAMVPEGLGLGHMAHPVMEAASEGVTAAKDGEGVYFGTVEPSEEQAATMRQAAGTLPERSQEASRTMASAVPAPDIHSLARQIDPEAFAQYDPAMARHASYTAQLNDLTDQRDAQASADYDQHSATLDGLTNQRDEELKAQAPYNDNIAELQEKLAAAGNKPTVKTARYQDLIDDFKAKNDDWISQNTVDSPEIAAARQAAADAANPQDTPDMAMLRQKRYENALGIQQIADTGRIRAAYAEAAKRLPETDTLEPDAATEAQAKPGADAVGDQAPDSESAAPAAHQPIATPADTRPAVAQDISQKWQSAGHDAEQSDALGDIVSNMYQRIADQFDGKKGTAQDVYQKYGYDVQPAQVRTRTKELAQGATKNGSWRPATQYAQALIKRFQSADASTLIHETAHHWLDQMVQLADDLDAPKQLTDDVQGIKDYLGADGTGPHRGFTTAQHEKFARSFERYFMEGVAPTKALARAFSAFKGWMMDVYKTINTRRFPINDNVRAIFDRFFTDKPEHTVISPDHDMAKAMADIHEQDAETTSAEHAAATADAIRSELKRTAEGDTIAHDAITQAEGSTRDPQGAKQAAGDGETEASEEIGEGGDQAAPDSSSARDAGSVAPDSTSGTIGRHAGDQQSGSSEQQPRSSSELVDKAGNIRLDNLNTSEDITQVIRQTADDNGGFLDARGVVPDDQILKMADAMGGDVDIKHLGDVLGKGQLSSKIVAARKLLIQSATNVRDLMAKAADGSDSDVMAYAEAKARHMMIQESLSAVTAEAGRALRAFRDLTGNDEAKSLGDFLKDATGKDLFQLRREAKLGAALDTPEKVSKFIADSQRASFGDMILEYWINGLISGPATHTTYAVGNMISTAWKAGPDTAVASLVGKAHEALGKEGSGIALGEVGAQAKSAITSLPTALSAAGKALKSGVTTLLPGEDHLAMPLQDGASLATPGRIGNEAVTWTQLRDDTLGALKGMRDAFVTGAALVKSGGIDDAPLIGLKRSSLGSIPDIAIKGVNALPIGSVIRTPGRAIAAIHSFFRAANYSMDKSALAFRAATSENLSGVAFNARVADLMKNPTDDIIEQAKSSSSSLTLMDGGGEFTKAISKLTNVSVNLPLLGPTKLLKFIDPFVHIGSNVIEQAVVRRTPFGLMSEEIRADLAGTNGPAARDFAYARMITGTALAMTGGGLAAEGLMSGSGPSNPRDRGAWMQLGGNQPHSVRIGEVWYDMHRLGPLGMLAGISADMYDVAHQASREDMITVGASVAHAFAQNIMDESFMKGPSDLIQAVSDSDRYGPAYIRNFASSFVPFSVGLSQEARAIDPYTRQTRTIMDAIKAKIPYKSETLYPKRDVWGEPVPNKDTLGPAGLSAIYESRINRDPVNQTLLKLGIYPAPPLQKIRGVQLSEQEYDDYARIAGRQAKLRLNSLVNQPNFTSIPQANQFSIIRKIIETSREQGRSAILMQYPDVAKQAVANKRTILQIAQR
jgi:hypothetical protein